VLDTKTDWPADRRSLTNFDFGAVIRTIGQGEPDTENIRGLNLAVVKLTTVQVNKLPL
jgi:hypothetical protein